MVGNLNYKNLPMQVYRQDGTLIATVDFGCTDGAGWKIWNDPTNTYSYWYSASQDVEYDPYRFSSPPPPGGFGEACGIEVYANSIPSLVDNELLSFRTQRATWRIESISGRTVNVNPADGRLLLWPNSMLILKDTPGGINDLPVRVSAGGAINYSATLTNDTGGDPGLTDQGAGGTLQFLLGDWYACQPYTTIEPVPFNVYDAKLNSVQAIFEIDKVSTLRLENAGVYSGDYAGVTYEDANTVVLPTKWIGDQVSGTWLNDNLRLTVPGTSVTSTASAKIEGVGGQYNGIYTLTLVPGTTDKLDIDDVWFNGTDSGDLVFADAQGEGTGIAEDTFEFITITISGTANYNGTYGCAALRDLGQPLATFLGGDLNGLYEKTTEVGSWVEVGGLGRSGSITMSPVRAPEAFTAVEPQLSGDIDFIWPGAFRVNVASPQATVDDWARLFDYQSGGISAADQWHVRAVGPGYVDLEGLRPTSYNPNGNITFSRRRS